ncbi:MAG: RAD55 family ATPase [Thermoproteus sp.]
MDELRLRGVTLVYGPAGAGKTTFAAWYAYGNYSKTLWVSAFEDEATFRANMSRLGYDFGDRLAYWEAPLVDDVEALLNSLMETVAAAKPELLVVDSVSELIYRDPEVGAKAMHNMLYKLSKTFGVDVIVTAERQVAERLTYIADNVVELRYEVFPYGTVREMVVRKVRGGKAGYAVPFAIAEGLGFVPIRAVTAAAPGGVLKTGVPCLDETLGGLVGGAVSALIGPTGSGKSTVMLKAAENLKKAGKRAYYLSFLGDADLLRLRYDVESINAPLDVESLLLQLYILTVKLKADAVFIDGIDLLARFFEEKVFNTVLLNLIRLVKASGVPVLISLTRDWGIANYLDAVAYISERRVTAVKTPAGAVGAAHSC